MMFCIKLRLRSYVKTITQVRALLKGERVPLAVTREERPLRLNLTPQPEIPILLAASSPKSIHIAGELCDGWLPFLYPRNRLAEGIALLGEGTARSDSSQKNGKSFQLSQRW